MFFFFHRFIMLKWLLFPFSFVLKSISRYCRFFLLFFPSTISLPFLSSVFKSRNCFCTQAIVSGYLQTFHPPTIFHWGLICLFIFMLHIEGRWWLFVLLLFLFHDSVIQGTGCWLFLHVCSFVIDPLIWTRSSH